MEQAKALLAEVGIAGMTVTEVTGFSRQKGRAEVFRGNEHLEGFVPKIKLEIVVSDRRAAAAIGAVVKSARTGTCGDGVIFIEPVEYAVRIRTEEEGENAI